MLQATGVVAMAAWARLVLDISFDLEHELLPCTGTSGCPGPRTQPSKSMLSPRFRICFAGVPFLDRYVVDLGEIASILLCGRVAGVARFVLLSVAGSILKSRHCCISKTGTPAQL